MPNELNSLIYAVGYDFQKMKPILFIDSYNENSNDIEEKFDQISMDLYLKIPNMTSKNKIMSLCAELKKQELFLHKATLLENLDDDFDEKQLERLGKILIEAFPDVFLFLRTSTDSEVCFEFITSKIENLKIIDQIINNLPSLSKLKFIHNDSIEWGKFVKRKYSNIPIIITDYYDYVYNEVVRVNCFMDVSKNQRIPRFLLWWHLHKEELKREIDVEEYGSYFQMSMEIALYELSQGLKCSINKSEEGKYILSLLPDDQDKNIELAQRILDIYKEHDNWELQIRFTNWKIYNTDRIQVYVTN